MVYAASVDAAFMTFYYVTISGGTRPPPRCTAYAVHEVLAMPPREACPTRCFQLEACWVCATNSGGAGKTFSFFHFKFLGRSLTCRFGCMAKCLSSTKHPQRRRLIELPRPCGNTFRGLREMPPTPQTLPPLGVYPSRPHPILYAHLSCGTPYTMYPCGTSRPH